MQIDKRRKEEERGKEKAAFPVHTATTAIRVALATLFPQFAFGLGFVWIGIAPYAMRQSYWSPLVIEAIYALTPLSASLTFLAFWSRIESLFFCSCCPRSFHLPHGTSCCACCSLSSSLPGRS